MPAKITQVRLPLSDSASRSSLSTEKEPFHAVICLALTPMSSFTGVSKPPRGRLSIYTTPICSYARRRSDCCRENLSSPGQSSPSSNIAFMASRMSPMAALNRSLTEKLSLTQRI